MDFAAISQMIGTLGFPIVACAFMYAEQVKTRKSHEEEAKLWAEALNNNTRVLERLEVMVSGILSSDQR